MHTCVNPYLLARSICDAAGWQTDLLRKAACGQVAPELEDRLDILGISAERAPELIQLACDLSLVKAESESTSVRILSSRPDLLEDVTGVWAIGQEWLELIRAARQEIVFVLPALDEQAASNLRDALSAAHRSGVALTVVYGTLGSKERLANGLAILRSCISGAKFLAWPSEMGFLHAKLICIDAASAYVGSANLTDYGWHRNIELGVTLGGLGAKPLIRFCYRLIGLAEAHASALES